MFESDDIDILIMPINELDDLNNIKTITRQISLLIKWIFNISNNESDKLNYIQILPYVNNAYPYIDKISYKNQPTDYDSKYYTALVDIDYGQENNNIFYEDLSITNIDHPLFGKIIYKYQNINKLFLEKLFYLNYYASNYEFICYNPFTYNMYVKLYADSVRFITKFSKQLNTILNLLYNKLNYPNKYIPPHKKLELKTEIINQYINENNLIPVNNLNKYITDTHYILNQLRLSNSHIYKLPKLIF